jgi:hypothetical protein
MQPSKLGNNLEPHPRLSKEERKPKLLPQGVTSGLHNRLAELSVR